MRTGLRDPSRLLNSYRCRTNFAMHWPHQMISETACYRQTVIAVTLSDVQIVPNFSWRWNGCVQAPPCLCTVQCTAGTARDSMSLLGAIVMLVVVLLAIEEVGSQAYGLHPQMRRRRPIVSHGSIMTSSAVNI